MTDPKQHLEDNWPVNKPGDPCADCYKPPSKIAWAASLDIDIAIFLANYSEKLLFQVEFTRLNCQIIPVD